MRARVSHLKNPPKNPQLQFSFDKHLCRNNLAWPSSSQMLQTCEFPHLILCHCWPFPTVEHCTKHVSTKEPRSSSRPTHHDLVGDETTYLGPCNGGVEDERWMEFLLVKLRPRSLRRFVWSQSTPSYGERRSGALNFKVRPPLEASLPHRNLPMPT